MDSGIAYVLGATIAAIGVFVTVLYNDRRERAKIAAAAVDRTETEMERALRERLEFRDEQIEHLKEKIADQEAKMAQQQLQITELTERLGTLQREVHHG